MFPDILAYRLADTHDLIEACTRKKHDRQSAPRSIANDTADGRRQTYCRTLVDKVQHYG
jgi:hypothetical protein